MPAPEGGAPAVGIGRKRQFEIYAGGGPRDGCATTLGAVAVGLGRPYVWGLAADAQAGVSEVVRNMRADFDLTMGLAGATSVDVIGHENRDRA